MARGALSENERYCLDGAKNQSERLPGDKTSDAKPTGLRVRFLDEEGKTERLVSTDEVDCSAARVKKIHFQKNRSSSEASLLLRHNSMSKRHGRAAERRLSDVDNNNSASSENLNGKPKLLKLSELPEKSEPDAKDSSHFKRNSNVYSVNQAKTLTPEKKKSVLMPKLAREKGESKSQLPGEACLADAALGREVTARALGRLSRGLGRLLRRTNSVRISDPDPVYKVAYLGNVLTGWARGEFSFLAFFRYRSRAGGNSQGFRIRRCRRFRS